MVFHWRRLFVMVELGGFEPERRPVLARHLVATCEIRANFHRASHPPPGAGCASVYLKSGVMTCEHNGLANMDHTKGYPPDVTYMTSKMCMKCGWHLYGPRGAEREYTRAEWEACVNSAFDGERFEIEPPPLPADIVQLACQAVLHLKRRGVID